MSKKEIYAEAENFHDFGIRGIIKIIKSRKPFKRWQFLFSCSISIIVSFLTSLKRCDISYSYITSIVSSNLSIFPSLVGFSITSFVLIFNTGNFDLFKRQVVLGKYSFYQNAIAIFAYTVYLLLITLILSYSIKLLSSLNIIIDNETLLIGTNSIVMFFLTFMTLYSVLHLFSIAANIFTVAQMNSLYNTVEKKYEESKPEKEALLKRIRRFFLG